MLQTHENDKEYVAQNITTFAQVSNAFVLQYSKCFEKMINEIRENRNCLNARTLLSFGWFCAV